MRDLAKAAGVGIEDCFGVAKAAKQGQHVVQLEGEGILRSSTRAH